MTIRDIIPAVTLPQSLPVLNFEQDRIHPNVPFYYLKEKEDLVRLSFVFEGGSSVQEKTGVASAFSKLLLSGTSTLSAYQVAERLDEYGAYLDVETSFNELHIQLFCLRSFLQETLDFLLDVFADIKITQEELEHHKEKSIESLRLNMEKTGYLAKRSFFYAIYGNSLYGKPTEMEDIESITVSDLENFHKKHFLKGLKTIYSNTEIPVEQLARLALFSRETADSYVSPLINPSSEKKFQVQKNDAVQSSIVIGFDTINRKHPDYPKLNLLNTILGGYFGSRLMKNIREEKGYTYGIHCGINHLPDRGNFTIRTDVKNDVKDDAVNEIFREIVRLKEEFVGAEELEVVKNYMLGSLQRSFDGSLAMTDRFKTINDFGLNIDYFNQYMETIKSATAQELISLANKYWDKEKFYTVVAGNFE